MNRLYFRTLGLTIGIGSLLAVHSAKADEPVTGPDLNSTKGKPLDPPAPVSGATPKLVGVSAFAGAAMIDMGPVNDRLDSAGPGRLYPKNLPILFPILGGQGFGLFSRFLIGGSGAGLLSRSVDESGNRQISRQRRLGHVRLRLSAHSRERLSLGTGVVTGRLRHDRDRIRQGRNVVLRCATDEPQHSAHQQRLFDGHFARQQDDRDRQGRARSARSLGLVSSACVLAACTAFRYTVAVGSRTAPR